MMLLNDISYYIATVLVLVMLLYVFIKMNKLFHIKEDLK